MEKKKLISFIDKYYLAGNANSTKLVVEDKTMSCDFITDDQNVVGTVSAEDFDLPNGELGVYATSQLVKILSALENDINIDIKKAEETAYSLQVSDSNSDATFMLADLAVIRQVPKMKQLPDFTVKIKLDKGFADRFIKSKNALPESTNFAVNTSNNKAELIINYSSMKTSRITFNVDATVDADIANVCFNANLFKEILTANKDATEGSLEVSSAGLARVTFKGDGFASTYYLVQLQPS
jgi:hypothetical protein